MAGEGQLKETLLGAEEQFEERAQSVSSEDVSEEKPASAEFAKRLLTGSWGWLLAFFVGMGPWLVINGTFMEVALIEHDVPEGKAISSLLGTATQLGNVVPFLVVIIRQRTSVALSTIIFIMNAAALVACALLAFCWTWQTTVPGWSGEHSTGLLLFTLLGGFVGTCSKVVLFPYASRLPGETISAVSTGMGASGLLPVLLGLAQSSGLGDGEKRFTVRTFYLVTMAFVALANIAFLVLHRAETRAQAAWGDCSLLKSPAAAKTRSQSMTSASISAEFPSQIVDDLNTDLLAAEAPVPGSEIDDDETIPSAADEEAGSPPAVIRVSAPKAKQRPEAASKVELLRRGSRPLVNQLFVSGINYAVFPGMLPFLSDSTGVLFLTSAYYVTNLFGRWMPTFYKFYQLEVLNGLQVVLYVYYFWAAAVAGDQPLAAMVSTIIIFSFNNGYCATMVYESIRADSRKQDLEFLLQAGGICGQIGGAVGTLLTALLVSQNMFSHLDP